GRPAQRAGERARKARPRSRLYEVGTHMDTIAKDFGIVDTTSTELPVLAVNVLDRLGYTVSRASRQLDQVLAYERLDEKIGRDWWHHEYRVVLSWTEAQTSGVIVDVEVVEK